MSKKTLFKKNDNRKLTIFAVVILIIFLLLVVYVVRRYAPSRETMKLTDYFKLEAEDEAAVICGGEYIKSEEGKNAVISGDKYYLALSFVKDYLDDGYVYDSTEKILRYTTDQSVITCMAGQATYQVDKDMATAETVPVIETDDGVFLSADWIKAYTDYSYYTQESPNRIVIEKAGWEKKVGTIKSDTEARRYGGVKSKILSKVTKGQKVIILEDYTKWSKVLTDDGVIGCVQDNKIKDVKEEKTEKTLEERKYNHNLLSDKVLMTWHQVSKSSNGTIDSVLNKTTGINVISPTWFYIDDNNGSIASKASTDYVAKCHARGVQVWGLLSNLENKSVDSTLVLNTTSSRDNLVNQTIAAAIASGIDGINVDIEALSKEAKDGYLEFIRELSLKCEKNDLVLSVDNYVPTEYTAFYGREEQAKYADYVIVMAYDEHYSGSEEAGSVSSLSFVKNGVKDTLKEVPKEQIILALPFYTRVWCTENGTVSSKALGMEDARYDLKAHNAEVGWDEKTSQNYGEYKIDSKLYQCWLEDAKSLAAKMQVMKDSSLAGVSFWKTGFEADDTWSIISSYMK